MNLTAVKLLSPPGAPSSPVGRQPALVVSSSIRAPSARPSPPPKPRSPIEPQSRRAAARGARRAPPAAAAWNFPGNVSAQKSNVTPRVTAGPKCYRPGTLFRGVTLLRW